MIPLPSILVKPPKQPKTSFTSYPVQSSQNPPFFMTPQSLNNNDDKNNNDNNSPLDNTKSLNPNDLLLTSFPSDSIDTTSQSYMTSMGMMERNSGPTKRIYVGIKSRIKKNVLSSSKNDSNDSIPENGVTTVIGGSDIGINHLAENNDVISSYHTFRSNNNSSSSLPLALQRKTLSLNKSSSMKNIMSNDHTTSLPNMLSNINGSRDGAPGMSLAEAIADNYRETSVRRFNSDGVSISSKRSRTDLTAEINSVNLNSTVHRLVGLSGNLHDIGDITNNKNNIVLHSSHDTDEEAHDIDLGGIKNISNGSGSNDLFFPEDLEVINDDILPSDGVIDTSGHNDDNVDDDYDDDDDDYEPDWRDQIYYWTGLLSFNEENSCLLWKGSWLGSFTGKPNSEEFAWSSNEFEYSGECLTNIDDLYIQGLLRPKSGFFKGYYLMDNDGSGNLEKYLDTEYYVEFEEVRGLHPPRYTVIGKGESDFGTFVLTGTYNAGTRVLEMARQYISDDDERCAMNISQLKMHLIAAAARLIA